MPPVAGAILGFYLSWRISEVCLGPWHFTAPLLITHYSSNCFWFVCLRVCPSVSACVCYILWQLPICALSMEHFPHNWVFPSGPQARLERHDAARQKCVVVWCGISWLYLESSLQSPRLPAYQTLPGCCAVLRPRLPFGRQTVYALSHAPSLSRSLALPHSLSVFWQLPGRASSSA